MSNNTPRRGRGTRDVPAFVGELTHLHGQRIGEILFWARDTRQSWLLEFFERRLAGATTPDPQAQLVAAMTESRLAASHEALVLACEAGRILFANHSAQQVFAARTWLIEQDGQLKGATPALDGALQKAIAATLAATEDHAPIRLRLCPRGEGEALLLRLAPLRLPGSDTHARPFLTLHMLSDAITPQLDESSLTGWYGLSQAEARLAVAFANGASLADYAAAHDISINTVRTLFARLKVKLDAADQAAVVRKVLLAATAR